MMVVKILVQTYLLLRIISAWAMMLNPQIIRYSRTC